jgi:hypothetical protein
VIYLLLAAASVLQPTEVAADAVPRPVAFEEVSAEVGLDFRHFNGMSGKLYFAEPVGAGVALLDTDGDGDLDLYLGQGNMLEEGPAQPLLPPPGALPLGDRLYRNELRVSKDGVRHLRFRDVTEESGLSATGYNMGVATGDFNNDGWVDLYVTNFGPNQLLENNGDGTFRDVTRQAGVDDRRWSVPAVFFDFDGDGWLDLYVGNYVDFRVAMHKTCVSPTGLADYCGPLSYRPEPDRLLRNRGDGTFEDVSRRAGIADRPGSALGAIAADFDGDDLLDLYVCNDLMENRMWLNRGDGTFDDDALFRGTAVNANGSAQASMGVVAEDLNGDGAIDLFLSHLRKEYNTLYLNDGRGMFADRSRPSGLGQPSFPTTGFGTTMLDYNGDGIRDLFVANGAVRIVEAQVKAGELHPLRQANQLFRGAPGGRFTEVAPAQRQRPVHEEVSRGVAAGDVDNDGDPDLVVTNNAGPVRLLRNTRQPDRRWLGLRLLGPEGKRDALGAVACVVQGREEGSCLRVHTDGSYAAAADPRLLFRLPGDTSAAVLVRWPNGTRERFDGVEGGQYVTLRQGTGRSAAEH